MIASIYTCQYLQALLKIAPFLRVENQSFFKQLPKRLKVSSRERNFVEVLAYLALLTNNLGVGATSQGKKAQLHHLSPLHLHSALVPEPQWYARQNFKQDAA